MKSEFLLAFNQICSDRGLSREVVLAALENALASAYRHNVDAPASQNVMAKINLETGVARIFVEKEVVEDVADPQQQISLAEARRISPDAQLGQMLMVDSTPNDFGRIAAQSAKQRILQCIREAEREAQYEHFAQQEGEIVHGTVHSIKPQGITLQLGNAEALLPRSQQVPGEHYTMHQRLRAYVMEVRKTPRGPQITVSRSHKNMLRRLLELEVPEIFNGAVEIKAIAREAGSRSKVAVAARQPGVDPVGACVGMRGTRIQSIVNELGGEKIDVIEWDPDPVAFIAKALSPARVLSVQLEEDPIEGKTAAVIVPDDQLSLAIGRAGQNARLGAKLTGWRIDIQSVTEAAAWALQKVNEDPRLLPALGSTAELLPVVAAALRHHEEEKLPYNSEELIAARQVVQAVRSFYVSLRNAERARAVAEEMARRAAIEEAESERRAEISAARARIPRGAYEVPLAALGLSPRVAERLEAEHLDTVGKVMERLAEGDEGLLRIDGFGPRSLTEVKRAIEALALPAVEEAAPQPEWVAEEVVEPLPVTEGLEAIALEPPAVIEPVEVQPQAVAVTEPPVLEEVVSVAGEPEEPLEPAPAEQVAEPEPAAVAPLEEQPVYIEFEEDVEEEDEEEEGAAGRHKRKRDRRRPRHYIFDEGAGGLVAYRPRKRGPRSGGWSGF